MSDSLQPHGLEPAGFLCPWNSLSKSTGMGSHSPLQGLFPVPGIEPALQADSLPSEPPGKPKGDITQP